MASTQMTKSLRLPQAVQVNVGNGIVYSKKHNISGAAPHMFGTHSAPWFLFEAIKSSKYYTTASLPQAPLAPRSLCHRAIAVEIDKSSHPTRRSHASALT